MGLNSTSVNMKIASLSQHFGKIKAGDPCWSALYRSSDHPFHEATSSLQSLRMSPGSGLDFLDSGAYVYGELEVLGMEG